MPRRPTQDDQATIAGRLTLALENASPPLTRSQLAEKLGVTPGAISHYLNGNRPCPEHVVQRIAKVTKVEPGWILFGDTMVQSASRGSQSKKSAPSPPDLCWQFREAPRDGGKDFGNAGVYATPTNIETIVREDGQNSLDAGRGTEVVLRFRLVELSPSSGRYQKVVERLQLTELARHIRAIDQAEFESKLGTKLISGLEHVEEQRLVLLFVDDYGTHGLRGGEFDSTKPFSALVRDNLNSRKDSSTAGGIFGVGAKVNLACSRLSTVLIASKVEGEENRGTRLIGRTEMTYHQVDENLGEGRYAGPGWFGQLGSSGIVESVWLPDDDPILDDLLLRRDSAPSGVDTRELTGTSIMVVGFTDPQTEAGASALQLADHFIEATAVNFWPAMMQGRLTAWVECYSDDGDTPVKSQRVDPRLISGLGELCEAWEKHQAGDALPLLNRPGDVAAVTVPMSVPATRGGVKGIREHQETEASAILLVRLADPERAAGDPRIGHVAYVRGRAMVTRYQRRTNAVGGRPFHGVVLAGTLVNRSHPQLAAEQFLRIAEPPAHDRWTYQADVGEKYKRGGKKALDEFQARITEELQRVLKPTLSGVREGPEVLRRMLNFRPPAAPATQQPTVRILRSSARVRDGAWEVDAELSVNPVPKVIRVQPRLSFRCEGSAPIPVQWRSIQADDEMVREVEGHTIILKPRTKRVTFKAVSEPRSHPVEASESSAVLDLLVKFGGEG